MRYFSYNPLLRSFESVLVIYIVENRLKTSVLSKLVHLLLDRKYDDFDLCIVNREGVCVSLVLFCVFRFVLLRICVF